MTPTHEILLLALLLLILPEQGGQLYAQKPHGALRDSLDNAFDLSDYMIDAHGFIPVPVLITEPAFGVGGALAAVFVSPKKHLPQQKHGVRRYYTPPDITMGLGLYTSNGSWGAVAGRMGTFVRPGLSYRLFSGYMDFNIQLYKTFPGIGEKKLDLNFRTIPVYLHLSKRITPSGLFSGLQYTFLKTTVKANTDDEKLPSSITDKELDNITSTISPLIEFDNRDNMFTTNKGVKTQFKVSWSDNAFGSDFDYVSLNLDAVGYLPFTAWWHSGLRLDWSQMLMDPPFYMLPAIDLRGVPKGRYQNNIIALLETEQRFKVYKRWSLVAFTGGGKAFEDYESFEDARWVYNYGGGFRYNIARKFNLHMGLDAGFGPEDWGIYIIFGSAWLR